MKVTVITPCYNPGPFLKPMLESVGRNAEFVARHIVMDGGSTDGSVEVLREWSKGRPWFSFESEKDGGQSDACRKALEKVETEYFFWLNADDVMCDGAIAVLTGAIGEGDHPAIVYGDYLRIDGEGRVYARRRQPSFNAWDCLHGYITVQNAAAIFNAPMLRAAGGFDPSLRFVMDYDIVLKLGTTSTVRHVRQYCGAFRTHEGSKTMTIDGVCRDETRRLRIKYGVSANPVVSWAQNVAAKTRVVIRMAMQGCLGVRLEGVLHHA